MVSLPRCQPLAVTSRREVFDHPDWLFEIKWDGFRAVAYVEHGRCRLVSRNDNEFQSFKSLNVVIADELKKHAALIDGEIVSIDSKCRPQFYDLMFRRGEPRFVAFDLLWFDGNDLRHSSLLDRKWRLRSLIPTASDRLLYCDHFERTACPSSTPRANTI